MSSRKASKGYCSTGSETEDTQPTTRQISEWTTPAPAKLSLERSVTAPADLCRHARSKVACAVGKHRRHLISEVESTCTEGRKAFEEQPESLALIRAEVQAHPACTQLEESDVSRIVESMRFFRFLAGSVVAKEGDTGQYFFVVIDGVLDSTTESEGLVNTFGRGESFGGDALLYGGKQPTTIIAREDSSVWGVDGNTFRAVLTEVAQKHHAENAQLLEGCSLFSNLDSTQKAQISNLALLTEGHAAGERIVTAKQAVGAMYFVKSGELNVIMGGSVSSASHFTGGDVVSRLKPGDSFGKTAALNSGVSSVTVITETPCTLVCVSIAQMKALLGDDVSAGLEESLLANSLDMSAFISQFSLREKRRIVNMMDVRDVDPGEPIGTSPELIVVVKGDVCRRGDDEAFLQSGGLRETSVLAQPFMRRKSNRSPSITVHSLVDPSGLSDLVAGKNGARIATLTKENLAAALAEAGISVSTSETIEHARRMLQARKVPLFHHLSETQIEALVQSFISVSLNRGDVVFEQGSTAKDFWVIAKGEVEETIKGQEPRIIGKNGHFGVKALVLRKARPCTVRVSSLVAEFWQLEQETFDKVVTGQVRQELEKKCQLQDTPVGLKDLRPIKVIGKGGFGSVRMVEHQDAGLRYALKRVKLNRRSDLNQLRRECALLGEVNHPLIMMLVKTFEIARSMYILTELISGGDLFSALDKLERTLQRWEAQFYAGSLILVLEYLRDRYIVFRDLKPENVLLDTQGYIKLIDFGVAKKLKGPGDRSYSACGSYNFMAPEVANADPTGNGYGTEADIWSLGVMLFEFVCGYLPFGHNATDANEILKEVREKNLEFPQVYKDRVGKGLIRGMLRKDPAQRLGAGVDGYRSLTDHEYFHIDDGNLFDKILGRQLEAPYVATQESYQIESFKQDIFSDADLLCET